MTEIILIVSSIMMVVSFILIIVSLAFINKTFRLMVESLYECNSNINYIKNKLEKDKSCGKHQKLFEKED